MRDRYTDGFYKICPLGSILILTEILLYFCSPAEQRAQMLLNLPGYCIYQNNSQNRADGFNIEITVHNQTSCPKLVSANPE